MRLSAEVTMQRRSWVWLVCLVLAGCVSTGTSDLADDRTMAHIKVGHTTKQQVAQLLGDPASRWTIDMGGWTREWWTYSYASAVINPLDYLFLYGFLFNGLGLYDTRYDLNLFFDHRGVVSSLSKLKTDYDMGRPFTAKQVSSVSTKTLGYPEASIPPVSFQDSMVYRY